ncbi:hypothetical protein A3K73_02780 [Candidatus Pacearchaeota archaeon RBG_13_36_9]|nr:MAG: hypothetical protein A3K73_02780 [Candidatus Pacearchaeota archaeon RBG_13_36_9]
MYDPVETDISQDYLYKLTEKLAGIKFAVIGGWGVYFHVSREYQRAFGREYLKSRDIDVFVNAKDEEKFLEIVKKLGFEESAYYFRYELIYDREEKKIVPQEEAKKRHIFNLIYIFLDVFSNKKTEKLGAWVLEGLKKAKIETIGKYPVLDVNSLLNLKVTSFFEREKLDKELKDACDIYALLVYSGKKFKLNKQIKKAIEKIISRADLQNYIAENVLGDGSRASLVANVMKKLPENNGR